MTGHSPHISRVCPGLADMTRHLSCPARQVENWMNIFSSVVFVKWQNISAVESASINALVASGILSQHSFIDSPSQAKICGLTQKCSWRFKNKIYSSDSVQMMDQNPSTLESLCYQHVSTTKRTTMDDFRTQLSSLSCHSCH